MVPLRSAIRLAIADPQLTATSNDRPADVPPWHEQLASKLLVRHLQASFPRRETVPDWLPDGQWLPPDSRYARAAKSRLRTVAVIGAGATRPVLKLGEELADELESDLGVENDPDYRAELIRLERVYGFRQDQFETRLVAMGRNPGDQRKVRDRIADRYGIRHPSLVVYELIAHLLKHRFLDAVVSFNFDELLDQSLDDELGRSEYVRVVSESDCRLLEHDPDDPDYLPLYVKMHGTASEPETLRFTRESYYWTPKPIINAVEQLLDTDNLVLVNVGCRLASFDFQYLLREPRDVTLFHMDPKKLDRRVVRQITDYRKAAAQHAKVDVVPCGEGIPKDASFLPKAFDRLMEELESQAKSGKAGPVHWRSIGRHQVVAELLDRSRLQSKRHHYVQYLRQRAILEVAFATAKGRGVVSATSLVDERCGRYYDLYATAAKPKAQSWSTICAAGGLIESDESPESYYVDDSVCSADQPRPASRHELGSEHRLREIEPAKLAAHVLGEIDSSRWPSPEIEDASPEADRLRDVIRRLYNEDEVEIHSLDDRICSKIFVAPRVLRTHTAFQAWHDKMLEPDDYDEIRVVAETGGWLRGAHDGRPGTLGKGMVKLIVAFDRRLFDERPDGLKNLYGDTLDARRIPWWRHNRHMRLFCREGHPVRALYYARRLRTSMVTPVFLDDPADLKRLAQSWDLLWAEAKLHEGRIIVAEHGREEAEASTPVDSDRSSEPAERPPASP
jgi:hypothetical protein